MVRNIAALANSFNDFSVVPSQFVPPIKSYCVSRKYFNYQGVNHGICYNSSTANTF